jgi:hypothetical protein
MAIAPSRLGRFALEHNGDALVHGLRAEGLVRPDVTDEEILAAETRALVEHEALDEDRQLFNSPHERVRVFLEPLLSAKGRKWAEPIKSLRDESPPPWWNFWGR